MHPYYGTNQLNGAGPTLVENVSPNGAAPLVVNGDSVQQAPLPPFPQVTVTTSHLQQDLMPSAAVTSHSQSTQPQATPTMNNFTGNGFNFPLPPFSTAPQTMLFRSPALISCTSTRASSNFQFTSPMSSSAPPQMVAPTSVGLPSPWQHTVPISMPWASSSITSNITFTASSTPSPLATTVTSFGKPTKRKSTDTEHNAPVKVFINEERMAAQMQSLSLNNMDNNNLDWHPNLEEQWYQQQGTRRQPLVNGQCSDDSDREDSEDSSSGSSDGTLPKLKFADVLKIDTKTKDILPQVILDELAKPTMQLVLWKPPGDFVHDIMDSIHNASSSKSSSSSSSSQTSGLTVAGLDTDMDFTFEPGQVSTSLPFTATSSVWSNPADNMSVPSAVDCGDDDMDL